MKKPTILWIGSITFALLIAIMLFITDQTDNEFNGELDTPSNQSSEPLGWNNDQDTASKIKHSPTPKTNSPPALDPVKITPASALPIPPIVPQMPETAPPMPMSPPEMPEIAPPMPDLVRPIDGDMPYDESGQGYRKMTR